MPRRSERLQIKNKPDENKRKAIILQIRKRIWVTFDMELDWCKRLQYVYRVYDMMYKNFYHLSINNIRHSCLCAAYFRSMILKRNLIQIAETDKDIMSDSEKRQIQQIYNIFKKFQQLYERERTYLFNDVLRILPKLNNDVVSIIDRFL
jgi:hypothetical protein